MTDIRSESSVETSRRGLLAAGAGAIAAGALASVQAAGQSAMAATAEAPVLRVAHLTDIHVKPEQGAPDGMAAALRAAHALNPPVDFILQGGDAIMDAFAANEERTRTQWELWQRILAEECRLPIHHCIGNHDIWGWNRTKSATTGNEPRWGKQWALEQFEIERPYYSFDQGGWHFVVLDSVRPRDEDKYQPLLDAEQFEWLSGDLAGAPAGAPVLVLSHVPLLSVCNLFFYRGDNEDTKAWAAIALMHGDFARLSDLFRERGNVRAAVSGHNHLIDSVEYRGVRYLCDGAVSGNWWSGAFHGVEPAFAVLQLYADGRVEREMVNYGGAPAAAS